MLIENETDLDDLVVDLKDRKLSVLVLFGVEDGEASSLHAYLESKQWDPWDRWYLISDLELLSAKLTTQLEAEEGELYRVLGGERPKTIADLGEVSSLRRASDPRKWARLRVRDVFAQADQLGAVPGDHAQ